jgi:hypothetical protein
MPKNADIYPYILAGVDKKIYEMPLIFNGSQLVEANPKDIYAIYKEFYPILKTYIDETFPEILNVDYRTISKDGFLKSSKDYFIFELEQDQIDWYVKYVKKNKIILKGSCELQEPIIYSGGLGANVRLKISLEVISTNTKNNLLFFDSYGASDIIYQKKKYDIIVDYPLEFKLGSKMMFLTTEPLYDWIQNKEKSGIVEEQ